MDKNDGKIIEKYENIGGNVEKVTKIHTFVQFLLYSYSLIFQSVEICWNFDENLFKFNF